MWNKIATMLKIIIFGNHPIPHSSFPIDEKRRKKEGKIKIKTLFSAGYMITLAELA